MGLELSNDERYQKVYNLIQREKQERLASTTVTTETLTKLNTSIGTLPQKCQQILRQSAELQITTKLSDLDPVSIALYRSREISSKLEDEYQIFKLKQKNEELQARINRNHKFLESLRRELKSSVDSLAKQNPNPGNIDECLREMKQKVASYERSCAKSEAYCTKLSIPDSVMPKSLEVLVTTLATLRAEATDLKQRADDITLARDARRTFLMMRR